MGTSESILKPSTSITTEPNSGSASGPPKPGSVNPEAGVPTAATAVAETSAAVINEATGPNPTTAAASGVDAVAKPAAAANPPKSGTSENPNPGAAAAAATATATERKTEGRAMLHS